MTLSFLSAILISAIAGLEKAKNLSGKDMLRLIPDSVE